MSEPPQQDLQVVLDNDKRGLLTVEEGRVDVLQLSQDGRPPKRLLSCPLRQILRVRLSNAPHKTSGKHVLDIHALIGKGKGDSHDRDLRLSKMHVLVEPNYLQEAGGWVQTVMTAAYAGIQAHRRILLLVNPVGGKGKGKAIVKDTVLPILEAAACMVDYRETTHRLHAEEIVRDCDLAYDVIATASGDGLVYEVLNGLAARTDAKQALRMPIAPLPTGSANALCINLFGPKDTYNIPLACLNLIKGRPMPIDLASTLLLPSNKRQVCFLSIAIGLMVDVDIGTESMRWLGDTRFVLGFLRGIASNKSFKCRIHLDVRESDKIEMARKARERVKAPVVYGEAEARAVEEVRQALGQAVLGDGDDVAGNAGQTQDEPSTDGDEPSTSKADAPGAIANDASGQLPEARKLKKGAGWLTIESGTAQAGAYPKPHTENAMPAPHGGWPDGQGLLYLYAGTMPWVARDLMQWPVATGGEGLLDVVVQSVSLEADPKVPRATLVGAITGAEHGKQYWMDCQHYYKCGALIVENLDKAKQKLFTIDGEAFEFDEFHVEMMPAAARVMSLDGRYFVSDFLKQHDER